MSEEKREWRRKVTHKNLGECVINMECLAMQLRNTDPSSVFVEHDGDIKEVSRSMIKNRSEMSEEKQLKKWEDAPWKKDAEKLVPVLQAWQQTVAPLNQMYDIINDCFGFSGGGSFQKCFDTLEKSINKMPSILCDDNGEWLDWYRFENAMGEKGMVVSLCDGDIEKPVKTLFDLAVIITAPKS